MPHGTRFTILLLLGVLLAGCASSSVEKPNATVSKTLTHSFNAAVGSPVQIENLLGHVQIIEGGSAVTLIATVVAGGTDKAAAQALADSVKLVFDPDNNQTLRLRVDYPVGEHDTYRYIPTTGGANATQQIQVLGMDIGISTSSSSLEYQGHDVRVVRGKAQGVPLHVDLAISVPSGSQLTVNNHVGMMEAHNVHARLTLESGSGDMLVSGIRGDLSLETGSGDISISDQHGALSADTGSGDIDATRVDGKLDLDTGSGDISGKGLAGNRLAMDTGSGDIDVSAVSGALDFSTGAGDISISDPGEISEAHLDTGAGDILMRGDLSGLHAFDISAGSGDVTMTSAKPPTVHLDIEASSIAVRWPGLRNVQNAESSFSGDVGTASGEGHIHTSNGDVVLK